MRNTARGLEIESPPQGHPYARLTDDDRRLIRMLIIALATFTVAAVVGVAMATADLLTRDRERQETVAALLLGEERRRTNFELLTDYILCVATESRRRGGDPSSCPNPEFVPPPAEVKLVPPEMPSKKEGERRPSTSDGPP